MPRSRWRRGRARPPGAPASSPARRARSWRREASLKKAALRRLVEGKTVNSADWETIYQREYPRLLRALTAISGDEGAAEDAVHEPFLPAFNQRLKTPDRPLGWLPP